MSVCKSDPFISTCSLEGLHKWDLRNIKRNSLPFSWYHGLILAGSHRLSHALGLHWYQRRQNAQAALTVAPYVSESKQLYFHHKSLNGTHICEILQLISDWRGPLQSQIYLLLIMFIFPTETSLFGFRSTNNLPNNHRFYIALTKHQNLNTVNASLAQVGGLK